MWYGITIAKEKDIHQFNSLPVRCKTFVSMEPLLEETGRRKDKVVPKRKWIEGIVNSKLI